MLCRDFTVGEKVLVSFLLRAAGKDESYVSRFFLETQCVDLEDGGMGSLLFVAVGNPSSVSGRKAERVISSCSFTDEDGVLVSAALYVDTSGLPFELDVWKVDFSPLIRMPTDAGELTLEGNNE